MIKCLSYSDLSITLPMEYKGMKVRTVNSADI